MLYTSFVVLNASALIQHMVLRNRNCRIEASTMQAVLLSSPAGITCRMASRNVTSEHSKVPRNDIIIRSSLLTVLYFVMIMLIILTTSSTKDTEIIA